MNKNSIMTNTTKLFCFLIIFSFSLQLEGQSHLLFGEWKSYLSFKSSSKISETKNKIFCSNDISMFSIDKEDFSIEFIDKINALDDVEILDHKYDPYNNQLIIVYKNGNIDVLTDEDTYQIPDIKNNLNLLGQKEINDIYIANDTYAYFSFDFGVTEFNLKTFDFGFTCFTPFPVNGIVQKNNVLYMGTSEGLYSLEKNEDNNLADFLQWQKQFDFACTDLLNFNNSIYVLSDENLLKLNNDSYELIYTNEDNDYKSIFANSFEDYIVMAKYNDEIKRAKAVFVDKNDSIKEINTCASIIQDILIDENDRVWYTDQWHNIKWTDGIDGSCNEIIINSPYSNENWDIETNGDKIYISSGGAKKNSFDYADTRAGFYILEEGKWENYNQDSNDTIKKRDMINFLTIEPSPIDDRVFVGTNYGGILELNAADESIKVFDKESTGYKLDGAQGNYDRERVIDMQFDSDNNLWISNFLALKPLVVYTKDKKWYNFKLLNNSTNVGEMEVDANDNIWIKIVNSGVIVYNYNGTINDPTDDIQVSLTKSNTNMPSNTVNYIKTDLDGNVWVGTDAGPVVFECASGVFDGSCKGSIKVTVLEGIPARVLDKVNITAIEVDGANRKWIGSSSGVYVLSSSGEDELMHFTRDNSPLFDDNITDLAYNDETGEIIIGTSKGVLSYKTKTLEGATKNSRYAYAFPNPVSPDYDGPIAFKGLARDAIVKIVDVNGHLVFETKALGGQAIWNGQDLHGNRVGSGVYTALSTGTNSFEQPESIAVKVFFLR